MDGQIDIIKKNIYIQRFPCKLTLNMEVVGQDSARAVVAWGDQDCIKTPPNSWPWTYMAFKMSEAS